MNHITISGGRQTGKTTQLLQWIADGERIEGYPGWSRVLIVDSIQEVIRLRSIVRADSENLLLEDDAHRIYHLEDWRKAVGVHSDVEVALDRADLIFNRLVGPGRLSRLAFDTVVDTT